MDNNDQMEHERRRLMDDKDRLELERRRLTDDVRKGVEAQLKWRYTWMGLIAAAVIGIIINLTVKASLTDAEVKLQSAQSIQESSNRRLLEDSEKMATMFAQLSIAKTEFTDATRFAQRRLTAVEDSARITVADIASRFALLESSHVDGDEARQKVKQEAQLLQYPTMIFGSSAGGAVEDLVGKLRELGLPVTSGGFDASDSDEHMIVIDPKMPFNVAISALRMVRETFPDYRFLVSREYASDKPGREASFRLAIGISLYEEEIPLASPMDNDDWAELLAEGLTQNRFQQILMEHDWK